MTNENKPVSYCPTCGQACQQADLDNQARLKTIMSAVDVSFTKYMRRRRAKAKEAKP